MPPAGVVHRADRRRPWHELRRSADERGPRPWPRCTISPPCTIPNSATRPRWPIPGLISRAMRRGAWIHTDSAFVAAEVVEAFGADPTRVRVVNPGVPELPVRRRRRRPRRPRAASCRRDRPLLLGRGDGRAAQGPARVSCSAFGSVADRHTDVALVLAGPPGWGEDDADRGHRGVAGAARSCAPDGSTTATWRRSCAGARCWPIRRSTRGSASRRCKPCRPGCRSSPPGPARSPRSSADGAILVEPRRPRRVGRGTRTRASATRRRVTRLVAAGTAWVVPILVGALRRGPRDALPRRGRMRPVPEPPAARSSSSSSSSDGSVPGGIGVHAAGARWAG